MRTFLAVAVLMVPVLAQAADVESASKQKSSTHHVVEQPVDGEYPTVVLPESTTAVRLSSSDINRIACPADIREVLTSTEKGVTVKITGKDAFIKFKVNKKGEKLSYAATPTEMYVVCGEKVFSMVIIPQRIPSQTIRLSSGQEKRIKDNVALYSGLPFEKKVLKAIRDVYTENIPDSYTVATGDRRISAYRELHITLRRTVDIEGEGLRIKEYEASPGKDAGQVMINERMFLKTDLTENPVAVSLERHVLRTGESSRVFVVEQRADKSGQHKLSGDLPVMDMSHQNSNPSSPSADTRDQSTPQPASESQEAADEK